MNSNFISVAIHKMSVQTKILVSPCVLRKGRSR